MRNKFFIAVSLILAFSCTLAEDPESTKNNEENKESTGSVVLDNAGSRAADDLMDFNVKLASEALAMNNNSNTVFSPLSATMCLAMVANGVTGEFAEVFGLSN